LTDNGKNYYGGYVQDDWEVSPKLTLNVGVRYDFFGLVFEHHSIRPICAGCAGCANLPNARRQDSCNNTFVSASFHSLCSRRTKSIVLPPNKYGSGLGNSQKDNFAPRLGFCLSVNPKLVVTRPDSSLLQRV